MLNDIYWKTALQKPHGPKIWYWWTQPCHAKRWWDIVGVVCMLTWHVAFWMFRAFPSLTMDTSDICCCRHFSFRSNGHVAFWWFWAFSLHLQWACWTFAVLGIFSFHSNRHVAFWLFWASFPFIQTGVLRFGCSRHLFPSWSWACCIWAFRGIFPLMQMGMSHIGCFGHVVLSLKWNTWWRLS